MARLPILMYHDVARVESTGLTISERKLERQFSYLAEKGYKTYHFRDLEKMALDGSNKNIILTFDDAYLSHMELVLPLLKKFGFKAIFFAPLSFLGKKDLWNTSSLEIMSVEQLKSLDPKIIELGYHSYYHNKYTELTNSEIEADTRNCMEFVSKNELNFAPVMAYPYGKFPRDNPRNDIFNKILSQNGIKYGLRIGNRINEFPFKKPFEIERIDVKGEWSLLKFKRKIRFGKLF